MRTRGKAGAAYYSPWRVSSNTVRRNIVPLPPATCTAKPDAYTTEDITLVWTGAAMGTSPHKQYIIQKRESADKVTWDAWENVTTVPASGNSGSTIVTPTRVLERYTRYRVCVQDTLQCLSGYRNSNSIYSLSLPFAPVVAAPAQDARCYNRAPWVLLQTQAAPGGKLQRIFVRAPDGTTYNSVDHPGMFSVGGASTGAVKTAFRCPAVSLGQHSITVFCRTDSGDSAPVTRTFTVAASPFTPILPETPVKAAQVAALRAAAGNLRKYYSLAGVAWSPLVAGKAGTAFWPLHMRELQKALESVTDTLAAHGEIVAITWPPPGTGRPHADVMNRFAEHILKL